jgi:hypothetical protein
MNEKNRRLLFLILFALVFYQTGAHISQAFINYPAWGFISRDSFPKYHVVIKYRAGAFVVIPRMIELVLAIVVLRFPPAMVNRWMIVLAIALALCAFLSTAFIQRPIHVQLEKIGNTPELLARLTSTNWLRLTAEWLRAALYLWMMFLVIRPQRQVRKE